jgi:hypothetical protein
LRRPKPFCLTGGAALAPARGGADLIYGLRLISQVAINRQGAFDPASFRDHYEEAVIEIIRK